MSGFPQSVPMDTAEKKSAAFLYNLMVADKTAESVKQAREMAAGKGDAWIREYLYAKKASDFYSLPRKRTSAMSDGGKLTERTFMGIYVDGYVIPRSPIDAFKAGEYNRVPLIIGCTTEELRLFLPVAMLPTKEMVKKLAEFDPDNPKLSIGCFNSMIACPIECYLDSMSKKLFREEGVDQIASFTSAYQSDVYVYLFGWNDEPKPFNHLFGAAHSIDVAFWLGNFDSGKDSVFRMAWCKANKEGREKLSGSMMSYLANFVKTGNPNAETLPEWTAWTPGVKKQNRMIFDGNMIGMSSGK
jgi:para-nitrobenzyl esterase